MNAKIDEFILAVDGLQKHAPDFNPNDAKYYLEKRKILVRYLKKLDNILATVNYGNDLSLKSKFKYSKGI